MVVAPLALPGETVKLAVVAPAGMATVAGTVAAEVLLLLKPTARPPDPAGAERVTVRVPGATLIASGLGVSVITTGVKLTFAVPEVM